MRDYADGQAGGFLGQHLTPYTDVEMFYDTRYDKVNEIRYTAGLKWSVGRFLGVDSFYTRQRKTTLTPEYVNALGLKLEFFFRNNPKR